MTSPLSSSPRPARMAHSFTRNRTAILVVCGCVGLGLANWISVGAVAAAALVGAAVLATVALGGWPRGIALGLVLVLLGLGWGTLRLGAMRESALASDVGTAGPAELVVAGSARHTTWSIRVPVEVRAFRGRRLRERALLVLPVGRSPPQGAIVDAEVAVAAPRGEENGFDEREWLARHGMHVLIHASVWRQVGRRGGVAGIGDALNRRVERAVERGAGGLRGALVLGIVLGDDGNLPPQVRHDFKASGLYHLLAVSGQNVAFIAAGIFGIGWLFRAPRIARELSALGAIGGYVLAVGWQPSVVRAGVAGALASGAWLVGRPRDRWHFLAVGALVLLAWSPASALDPGFQLSFAAVAGIFGLVPPLRRRLDGYPMPRRLGEVLVVASVCGLVTAPILLADFAVAPVYTVPANALAEPAMPAVLGLGLLAAVVDPIAPGAAAALAWLAGWAAAWLELVARVFASLPGAQIGPRNALLALVAILLVASTAALVWRDLVRG